MREARRIEGGGARGGHDLGFVRFICLLCGDANYSTWPGRFQRREHLSSEGLQILDIVRSGRHYDYANLEACEILLLTDALIHGNECVKLAGRSGEERPVLDPAPPGLSRAPRDRLVPLK